jgi:hypothetical protein
MQSQTAVEWFAEKTAEIGYVSSDILNQAKEMEKEQIVNAYENGSDVNDDLKPLYGTPEQYYNETYNNKSK